MQFFEVQNGTVSADPATMEDYKKSGMTPMQYQKALVAGSAPGVDAYPGQAAYDATVAQNQAAMAATQQDLVGGNQEQTIANVQEQLNNPQATPKGASPAQQELMKSTQDTLNNPTATAPNNISPEQQAIIDKTQAAIDESNGKTQKAGGNPSSGTQNQGLTSKTTMKDATKDGPPKPVFKVKLIENYADFVKPISPPALKQADWYRTGQPSDNPDVEGPYKLLPRSLDEFDNEETDTASIRVVNAKNEDLVPPYSKFILESVTEGHAERSQIVETFGDFYVFLFGERPPVYTYAGTLINSRNANWVSDFSFYYENYLRGTKCVENNAMLVLTYAGAQVVGYMINASYSKNSTIQSGVRFNFQVIVTSKKYLGFSDDFSSYVQDGVTMKDADMQVILDKIAGKTGDGSSDPAASSGQSLTFSAINGGPSAGVVPPLAPVNTMLLSGF